MADLVTTAEVLARVPSLATHPALAALVTAASAHVENHCRRVFASETLTEWHNGDGWARLWLRRAPVTSLTSVEVNGSAQDVDDFTVNERTGELVWGTSGDYRHGNPFPRGRRNIKVIYVAGYASVPTPVKEATVQVVKQLADAAAVSGVYQSESIGDYSYSLAQGTVDSLPPMAAVLLAPYVLDISF